MSAELANTERWRRGLSDRRAAKLERLYGEISRPPRGRGVGCAPLLRRTLERSQAAPAARGRAARLPREATESRSGRGRRAEPADLVFVGGTGRSGTTVIVQAAGPSLALSRRADRVPLPLQPKGLADVVGRPGDAGGVRAQAADLLVVPDPGRPQPGARRTAGAPGWRSACASRLRPGEPRAGSRPPPDRRPRALR